MIQFDNLTFAYRRGRVPAIAGVSATVPEGLHLLLGENGAGKTTLLHLMAGLQCPTEGQCTVDGEAVWPRHPATQCRTFFLPDTTDVPFSTMNEMGRLHGPFYPHFSADDLAEYLDSFGIPGDMKLKEMSLGMRRKAMLAYALALHTEVLLLDEPANGLDIDSRKEFRRLLGRSMRDGQTVVVSTHTVHDLGTLFDGLLLLSGGHLLVARPVWEIAGLLTFATLAAPSAEALYQEPDGPVFRAILPNDGGTESPVDFTLLYSAIMSPSRDAILAILNRNLANENDNDR